MQVRRSLRRCAGRDLAIISPRSRHHLALLSLSRSHASSDRATSPQSPDLSTSRPQVKREFKEEATSSERLSPAELKAQCNPEWRAIIYDETRGGS